ncbi:hypothetical protein Tco_0653365 [Tanacetum coccineum]|uniref:Uncharacterized protein n=1 Tax=Tanacetum coccineum TaxID=301880 RepID=A0ABQ4X064_9ASTR
MVEGVQGCEWTWDDKEVTRLTWWLRVVMKVLARLLGVVVDEEQAITVTEKKNLKNDIEDETLEIDEVVNIKESRNHPLENVIGNLNQRTLRYIKGTMHLGLWSPKGTGIETVVYADSDHAGDYVD